MNKLDLKVVIFCLLKILIFLKLDITLLSRTRVERFLLGTAILDRVCYIKFYYYNTYSKKLSLSLKK